MAMFRFPPGSMAVPRSSLVVPGVAAVGGLAFLVWRPGVALSVVRSPRALAFSVFVGALVLGFGWVLPRIGVRPAVTVITQAVPVVVAFAATVLPAFLGSTVDEPPPGDPAAVAHGLPGTGRRRSARGTCRGSTTRPPD